MRQRRAGAVWKITASMTAAVFAVSLLCVDLFRAKTGDAATLDLPPPTRLVSVSSGYDLPVLKGLKLDKDDPLHIEFIVDSGDAYMATKAELAILVRYFLAALTVPQSALWVNLSPYEKDRVMDDALGTTDLGKGMLTQDYLLKQLSSSLTYPDSQTGKAYWQTLAKAGDVAPDAMSKIWITPDKVQVYEHETMAVITEATLKVQSEREYLSGSVGAQHAAPATGNDAVNTLLPAVEKDVNHGRNFAQLRQMYHAIILALWFKQKFADSFYRTYLDKAKVNGIDLSDKHVREKVFSRYVQAFEKGAYDVVKKDVAVPSAKRRYFSGGEAFTKKQLDVGANTVAGSSITIEKILQKIKNPISFAVDLFGRQKPSSLGMDGVAARDDLIRVLPVGVREMLASGILFYTELQGFLSRKPAEEILRTSMDRVLYLHRVAGEFHKQLHPNDDVIFERVGSDPSTSILHLQPRRADSNLFEMIGPVLTETTLSRLEAMGVTRLVADAHAVHLKALCEALGMKPVANPSKEDKARLADGKRKYESVYDRGHGKRYPITIDELQRTLLAKGSGYWRAPLVEALRGEGNAASAEKDGGIDLNKTDIKIIGDGIASFALKIPAGFDASGFDGFTFAISDVRKGKDAKCDSSSWVS